MTWWQRFVQYFIDWSWTLRRVRVEVNISRLKRGANMNLQWPEIASEGITIDLKDAGGNIIDPSNYPKPADVTTSFACGDPTVVTFPPSDPTYAPYAASGTSTGKVAKDQTIIFTLNFNSGAPPLVGKSKLFDVPAGPPASADVFIGAQP